MAFILKKNLIFFLILMAGLFGTKAWGSVFTWIDEKGIKHFSNIAPPQNMGANRIEETRVQVPRGFPFDVVKTFDGDTIQVAGAGLKFKVRLVGIDSPEVARKDQPHQPFSQEAFQALKTLVHGKSIFLKQYGTGGYNRVLAEVFVNNKNINLEMIHLGLAEVYQGRTPPGLDLIPYRKAQAIAREGQKGIWGQGENYQSPGMWRKKNSKKKWNQKSGIATP